MVFAQRSFAQRLQSPHSLSVQQAPEPPGTQRPAPQSLAPEAQV
jgi:hypothetical protein